MVGRGWAPAPGMSAPELAPGPAQPLLASERLGSPAGPTVGRLADGTRALCVAGPQERCAAATIPTSIAPTL